MSKPITNLEEHSSPGQKEEWSPKYWLNAQILLEIFPVVFHKLKNKLTPILGYAQILKAANTDQFQSARLQKIETATLDLTELLNTLKENIHLPKGPRQIGNLNQIISSIEEDLVRLLSQEKIGLRFNLDSSIPDLPLHADEIKILIYEMVHNSIQSLRTTLRKDPLRKDPLIRLSTRTDASQIRLSIYDNGAGMTEQQQDQCWAPFFTMNPGKAGLGLVICEKIVKNHQAECKIQSKPEEFCEFTICFPNQNPQ